MRLFLALTFAVAVLFFGVAVFSSCVIDARDPDASADAEAGEPEVTDAGVDGDAPDVDLDCGCCHQAVLPLLPYCSGKVAFEVPSSDCTVPCKGRVAYVLCTGECYTACGCELPRGYTLFDAGFFIGEGGPDEGDTPGDAADTGGNTESGLEDAQGDL